MFFRSLINISILFIVFASFSIIIVQAQNREEVAIKFIKKELITLKCFAMPGNEVIDEAKFEKILKTPDCSDLKEQLKIDFSKHTLLSYYVGGDCMMRVKTEVFRNDAEKKYILRIKNLWGGCRAGGRENGLILIDKIKPEYAVEFTEIQLDKYSDGKLFKSDDFVLPDKTEVKVLSKTLATREVDLKNCIQTIFTKQFVIKDKESFLNAIRKDASRESCLNDLEKIDLEKNSLLGINLNSGYCRRPDGLKAELFDMKEEKQYVLNISYIDPKGQVCRALSSYDLWVLVPKVPAGYKVKFNVEPKENSFKTNSQN